MPSILNEYINRRLGLIDLQNELQGLIKAYNTYTGRYLFVYSADFNKRSRGVDVSLIQEDFYNIQDMLRESDEKKIDFYIETPGGSGEAAEEIAKFLRKKFEEVNFIIAGEAKSAGTILVLSGDNIFMTDTGSLGPIDAQVRIGRFVVSAHDYKEWIDQKRKEATKEGKLNPVDAVMIAQISPGELSGVVNSLEFAKDLVKEWLWKHKFKDWKITKTRQLKVTEKMKKDRAIEVADMFCDHTTWRTHGRSLKIEDLKDLLIIERIDDDKKLADIVYRIKTVIRLILEGSTNYKLFFIDDLKISKVFSTNPTPNIPSHQMFPIQGKQPLKVEAVEFQIQCPKCKKIHLVKGYFDIQSDVIKKAKLPVNPLIKDNNILVCDNCNFSLDLNIVKNQIEAQQKRKVTLK
jgi:hypothetical protein